MKIARKSISLQKRLSTFRKQCIEPPQHHVYRTTDTPCFSTEIHNDCYIPLLSDTVEMI